jgi:hypothetical protein
VPGEPLTRPEQGSLPGEDFHAPKPSSEREDVPAGTSRQKPTAPFRSTRKRCGLSRSVGAWAGGFVLGSAADYFDCAAWSTCACSASAASGVTRKDSVGPSSTHTSTTALRPWRTDRRDRRVAVGIVGSGHAGAIALEECDRGTRGTVRGTAVPNAEASCLGRRRSPSHAFSTSQGVTPPRWREADAVGCEEWAAVPMAAGDPRHWPSDEAAHPAPQEKLAGSVDRRGRWPPAPRRRRAWRASPPARLWRRRRRTHHRVEVAAGHRLDRAAPHLASSSTIKPARSR